MRLFTYYSKMDIVKALHIIWSLLVTKKTFLPPCYSLLQIQLFNAKEALLRSQHIIKQTLQINSPINPILKTVAKELIHLFLYLCNLGPRPLPKITPFFYKKDTLRNPMTRISFSNVAKCNSFNKHFRFKITP